MVNSTNPTKRKINFWSKLWSLNSYTWNKRKVNIRIFILTFYNTTQYNTAMILQFWKLLFYIRHTILSLSRCKDWALVLVISANCALILLISCYRWVTVKLMIIWQSWRSVLICLVVQKHFAIILKYVDTYPRTEMKLLPCFGTILAFEVCRLNYIPPEKCAIAQGCHYTFRHRGTYPHTEENRCLICDAIRVQTCFEKRKFL